MPAADADGDPLTYIRESGPDGGAVVWDAATGTYQYTPDTPRPAFDTITYSAADPLTGSTTNGLHLILNGFPLAVDRPNALGTSQ